MFKLIYIINTVLPLKLGAEIVALVGSFGTVSPYLDCLHPYSVNLIGAITGALFSARSFLLYIYSIQQRNI